MNQRTIRFGSYWLKVYKHTGDLRLDGGLNKFENNSKRQTANFLASADGHLEKISEFGRALTTMANDLLLQRKKKKEWFKL